MEKACPASHSLFKKDERIKCMSKPDLHGSGADTMLIQEAVSPSLQL